MKQQTFKVTLDKQGLKNKPTKQSSEEKSVFTRLQNASNLIEEVTIQSFAEKIASGHTFCLPIYSASRKNDTFIQTQSFGLDFDDSGMTWQEVVTKCQDYGLIPNLVYETFSSVNQNRFRVLFVLDGVVTHWTVAKMYTLALLNLFPNADQSCKDLARLYFGTNKAMLFVENTLNNVDFFNGVMENIQIGNGVRQQKLASKSVKNGYSHIDSMGVHGFYTFCSDSPDYDTANAFDFEEAKRLVKIVNDFENGKHLKHVAIFGLATYYVHCKGGAKRMTEIMNKYNATGQTHYNASDFATLKTAKNYEHCQRLEHYSTYTEDFELVNPIYAVKNPRGVIVDTDTTPLLTVSEHDAILKRNFEAVIATAKTGIHLIESETGGGKTQLLVELCKSTNDVVIAFPTHSLANEFVERCLVEGVKVDKTPQRLPLEDKQAENILQTLYAKGLVDVAMKLIISWGNGTDTYNLNAKDSAYLYDYWQEMIKVLRSPNPIVTTHLRLVYSLTTGKKFKKELFIFDESPLSSVLRVDSAKISELRLLALQMKEVSPNAGESVLELANKFENEVGGSFDKMTLLPIDDKVLSQVASTTQDITSNVVGLLKSDYWYKNSGDYRNNMQFVTHNVLPEDEKIIIMDATSPVDVWQALYKDTFTIYKIGKVKHTGNIYQYTPYSFSRTSFDETMNKDAMKEVMTFIDAMAMPVITFTTKKDLFLNAVDCMHFGNLVGYDSLKGKDIAVIGTPHMNPIQYVLIGLCAGLKLNGRSIQQTEYQRIEYNGLRYMAQTYNDSALTKIQQSLITSELLQAVGRARTLREDCTVLLFSNVPVRNATYIPRLPTLEGLNGLFYKGK